MAPSLKLKFLQGSASNLLRVLLSMVVSLLLPPFLVHRMPPAEYSAWILILQLSAYVNYLDFGVQTAIGKFVAEYDARSDRDAAHKMLSTAFSFMSMAALVGFGLIAVLTVRVPQLFRQMPSSLTHDVRAGLLCVGFSVCLTLPFSAFGASFIGLQEYGVLTLIQVGGRVLSALALVALILHGGTLQEMAWMIAIFNLATGLSQAFGWKRYASERVPFSFPFFDSKCFKMFAEYCGILSIWTMSSMLISGLDTTIVGHFDYANTGYYAVAGSATNFMLLLTSNILGPLLPAVSSLQTERSPRQIGALFIRATRLGVVVLLSLALPLLFCGYPLLNLWLGHAYAVKSVLFLEILVVGNVARQIGLPYAIFMVATGKQRYGTIAPILESTTNVVLSVLLARRYGAIGVAMGTLIAALIGLTGHLLISMHYTQGAIAFSRLRFILHSVLRPACMVLPTLLVLPFWHRQQLWPFNPMLLVVWAVSTFALSWFVGLTRAERDQAQGRFGRLLQKGFA